MFYQLFYSKFKYMLLSVLFVSILLLSFTPTAFAIPGASDDVPENTSNLGWIDLSATVPDDFTGSVSVFFKNIEDDSYFTVESFVLNNFQNSAQVPLGKYVVEAVTTSEDPFLYNVTCDKKEFELKDSFALHVTVTKNEAGAAFLAGEIEVPDTETEVNDDSVLSELESIGKTDDVSESSDDTKEEEVLSPEEEDESIENPEEDNAGGFWKGIIIRVVGILVFAGIFFGIYYFSRRKYQ